MASDVLDLAEPPSDLHWPSAATSRHHHVTGWALSLVGHAGLLAGLLYLATHWTTPPLFGLTPGRMSLGSRGSASAAPQLNKQFSKNPTQEIKVVFTDDTLLVETTPAIMQPIATAKPTAQQQPTTRLTTSPTDLKVALAEQDPPPSTDSPDALPLRRPQLAVAEGPKIDELEPLPLPRRAPSRRASGEAPPADFVADMIVPARVASPSSNGGAVDAPPHGVPANPFPEYPRDAWLAQLEGTVVLRISIGADGRVQSAKVEQSSGVASMDESARSTVERLYRYVPAHRGGVAVPYEGTLRIAFTIRR